MKYGSKIVYVCALFFGSFNYVVKANDSEIQHIVGLGFQFNGYNMVGMEKNLKEFSEATDEKEKYIQKSFGFGVGLAVNYDLYFNDCVALSSIIRGFYNKFPACMYWDGNGDFGKILSDAFDDEKAIYLKGGSLEILLGPKFNVLENGLSFTDNGQEGLRFAIGLCGGLGFNFNSLEIGKDSKLKDASNNDKIETSLLSIPLELIFEFVSKSGFKFELGPIFRFISPIKAKKDENNNSKTQNDKKTTNCFAWGAHVILGYDFGAIINS